MSQHGRHSLKLSATEWGEEGVGGSLGMSVDLRGWTQPFTDRSPKVPMVTHQIHSECHEKGESCKTKDKENQVLRLVPQADLLRKKTSRLLECS